MEKEELIRKGNKILLITACIVIPVLLLWMFYSVINTEPQVEQVVVPQYQDFDSTVWTAKKIKYKNIEKYADHTDYQMGFEDGSRSDVYWNFYMNNQVGDSVVMGETQTYRRRIN